MNNEAHARIVIDKLLEAAGWDITNFAQVSPDEAASDGRADYILKDTRTRPLAVIEAKRFSIDPYSAKEQAKEYATSLPVPFVILSNGNEHYFWDYLETDELAGLISPGDRKAVAVGDKKQWFFTKGVRIDGVDHKLRIVILWDKLR